jgi:seryl-tRNA synthetase
LMAALMELNQQSDGSIAIPDFLTDEFPF